MEAELKSCGVELVLGVKVESIEDGLKVHYASVKDGAKGTVEGDVVLMAGGRAPNTRGIGLDTIGVKMDRKGFVEVDGLCRTNVPGVYAIGDINGKMQLAMWPPPRACWWRTTSPENPASNCTMSASPPVSTAIPRPPWWALQRSRPGPPAGM